jgi:hypothetical protein
MELYETMDLRGVIWNYGLGWISALKEGWNVGVHSGWHKAEKIIEEGRKIELNPQTLIDFIKARDNLDLYYQTKDKYFQWKLDEFKLTTDRFYKEFNEFYSEKSKKPKNVNLPIVYWGHNKKGELVPIVENKKVPEGSLQPLILNTSEEVSKKSQKGNIPYIV